MNSTSKNKQSGVALITAVLIVALAVVASVSIAESYELNFRRTITAFNSGQAWSYAKGAEEWAKAILARDQKDNTYDAYDVDNSWWNNGQPLVFPLPDGYIEGKLEDAQGKLNVNALISGNKVDPKIYKRFERLFNSLGIDPALVGAIKDWIDVDQEFTGSGGAEADIYIGLEPPYLPADQLMEDISELRLVHGVDEDIYNQLLPHVTALPADTPLNLNTASALVLESLDENIPPGVGEELVSDRNDKPFKQPNDFVSHPSLKNIVTLKNSINDGPVGVGSDYFLLNTKCVIGDSQVKMVSMIKRGKGNNLNIVKRSQKL
ncbi:MAG: type II secretion system minor pseudopilin GspK [Gammaproteobacteria bacterium]